MFPELHTELFNGMASGSVAWKTAQSMEACACVRTIGILAGCCMNALQRIDLFAHVHLLADTPICRCLLGFLFPEATCANFPRVANAHEAQALQQRSTSERCMLRMNRVGSRKLQGQ